MKTVNEVAKLSGLTVRALHYYDETGLLKPDEVTSAGYRMYGSTALERLQQILFFRELGFELKEIKAIIDNPSFDKNEALLKHRELLKMKKAHIDGLIELTDSVMRGEKNMSIEEFNKTEMENAKEKYAQEAKAKWGDTHAYKQSEEKTAKYGSQDWNVAQAAGEEAYARFISVMNDGGSPQSEAAKLAAKGWQEYISKYFYDCTDVILESLAQMYVGDERFTENIDSRKPGLASFMSDSIGAYLKK
ncbi:MAG: MerR family transcriptional regulator [Clostridiales bacterium]|nr:MerR family transcriptional regulator [Clostridiales bacterium]